MSTILCVNENKQNNSKTMLFLGSEFLFHTNYINLFNKRGLPFTPLKKQYTSNLLIDISNKKEK